MRPVSYTHLDVYKRQVLKRDRTAVRRDVRILTKFGLVNTYEETNPGHGRRKIVGPLASKCELVTTI